MENFIGISREIIEHWIYKDAEYFQVWFEMLYRARFLREPKTETREGQLVTMHYGQFLFGRNGWSKRLTISSKRLQNLIKLLIKDDMIKLVKKYPKFTIYEVVNYEKYNKKGQQENQEEQGIEGNDGSAGGQHRGTKEDSKYSKDNIIIMNFEQKDFIKTLKTIENYPLDIAKDIEYFNILEQRYPQLDLVEAVKDFATYKLDNPFKKKDNPRSQLNTSCKNYTKWGKCIKKQQLGRPNDLAQDYLNLIED